MTKELEEKIKVVLSKNIMKDSAYTYGTEGLTKSLIDLCDQLLSDQAKSIIEDIPPDIWLDGTEHGDINLKEQLSLKYGVK